VQSAVLRSHVVHLSVRPSVCDVGGFDHIGWKSWKLITQTTSQHLRSSQPKGDPPSPRETWGNLNFRETRGGVRKMAFWRTKAAISLKRGKMEEKLLWRPYRNSPTLFRTVPSPTPYGLPFLEIRGLQLSIVSYLRNK